IHPGHQAPDRRRLRGMHPGEPAGHRPRSGAAPRHLRYARLPATAARRGGSGSTVNDNLDRLRLALHENRIWKTLPERVVEPVDLVADVPTWQREKASGELDITVDRLARLRDAKANERELGLVAQEAQRVQNDMLLAPGPGDNVANRRFRDTATRQRVFLPEA